MRSALGKGLSALISDETVSSVAAPLKGPVATIAIDLIKPNPKQPRRHFAETPLKELSESIKAKGVLQPILINSRGDGTYEIIAGERRWRASQMAGLKEIPAVIKNGSETERFEMALIENIQREDLNPIDLALGYQRLQQEFSLTQEAIAQIVGKDRAVVANTLRLLSLSPLVQEAVREGRISHGHARAIAAMTEAVDQERLLADILERDLPVRLVEEQVRQRKKSNAREHTRTAGYESRSSDIKAIEEELQRTLGRKVELHASDNGAKGWFRLEFYSLDDLEQLIARLKK